MLNCSPLVTANCKVPAKRLKCSLKTCRCHSQERWGHHSFSIYMALIKKKTFLFVRNITSKLYHIPFIECHCLPAYRSNNADIFFTRIRSCNAVVPIFLYFDRQETCIWQTYNSARGDELYKGWFVSLRNQKCQNVSPTSQSY